MLAAFLSNAALCYLKLRWPDRCKKAATKALVALQQAKDESFDQSKLYYRSGRGWLSGVSQKLLSRRALACDARPACERSGNSIIESWQREAEAICMAMP